MSPAIVTRGDALKPHGRELEFTGSGGGKSSSSPFLTSSIPKLELDPLPAAINCLDLEIDAKGWREGGVERSLL